MAMGLQVLKYFTQVKQTVFHDLFCHDCSPAPINKSPDEEKLIQLDRVNDPQISKLQL